MDGLDNSKVNNGTNDNMKNGGSFFKWLPHIYSGIALIAIIFSGAKLYYNYGKITDVRMMLAVHFILAVIWIVQGLVIYNMRKGGLVYMMVGIVLLLGTAYGLLTTHTMTKYVVQSGGYDSDLTLEGFKSGATMTVTSESLQNGVWSDDISNQGAKKNETPQLSFNEVPGATSYVVYMLDEDANNWMHWRAYESTKTDLAQNEAFPENTSSYVGPYPPFGTHKYVVYVFALKDRPDAGYYGEFNSSGMGAEKIYEVDLDVVGGEHGNVLAYGYLEGEYTSK